MPDEWTLMVRRCDDGVGAHDWVTVVNGPVVGDDGDTFTVVRRSEAERETVQRIVAALRSMPARHPDRQALMSAADFIDREFSD